MKIGIAALVMSLAFVGCSQQNSPVQPQTNVSISSPQTPDFLKLPKRLDNSLQKVVSVTQFVAAARGGTIRLVDTYRAAPDSHMVTINATLTIQPGDLPSDETLTVSLDDVLFLTNVDLAFAPHGIVFNRPVMLTVYATGLDLDINTTSQLKLFYIEDGVWTQMQTNFGIYYAGFGMLSAQGRLPHFSQYGFGRVLAD